MSARPRSTGGLAWCAVFALVALASPPGCAVSYERGCDDDGDCAASRLCLDGICQYPEALDAAYDLADLGKRVFAAFRAGREEALVEAGLSDADYDWVFDLGSADFASVVRFSQRERLRADFFDLRNASDFAASTFLGIQGGEYDPLPSGRPHVRHAVDRLRDSELVYRDERGREQHITLGQILRVRGRWKLFAFTTPVDPDGRFFR